jgi:hypothetical protein
MAMVLISLLTEINILANTDMESLGVKVDMNGLQEQSMRENLKMVTSMEKVDGRRSKWEMMSKLAKLKR